MSVLLYNSYVFPLPSVMPLMLGFPSCSLSLYLSLIGYCAHISNVIRVAVRSCKTTVARFLEHLRTNVSQLIMLKLLAVTDIP